MSVCLSKIYHLKASQGEKQPGPTGSTWSNKLKREIGRRKDMHVSG